MDNEAVARLAGSTVVHGGSDDPDVLDFSANTNPLVPGGAERVYREAFDAARTYPPDDYPDYREAAAAYVGCRPGEVVATPGGLAAIRLAVETTVDRGESVLVPYPSFGEYAREVRLQGARVEAVPHDELLDVARADLADHALAVACNPNNPTGDAHDPDELIAFADRCLEAGTPLLVDEAFLGFTDRPSLAGQDGVVVARSLTKLFGLPGIRAGFAVATGALGERLDVARWAWALGTPAAAVGAHCMGCDGFVAETRERVRAERERMRGTLSERFGVHPSDSPFLLLDVGERDVAAVVERARERGVALRDATTFRGLDAHVRVAVRLPEENDRLLEVLGDV
jgi:L-threonine-O-3-phosphate decarboxylase